MAATSKHTRLPVIDIDTVRQISQLIEGDTTILTPTQTQQLVGLCIVILASNQFADMGVDAQLGVIERYRDEKIEAILLQGDDTIETAIDILASMTADFATLNENARQQYWAYAANIFHRMELSDAPNKGDTYIRFYDLLLSTSQDTNNNNAIVMGVIFRTPERALNTLHFFAQASKKSDGSSRSPNGRLLTPQERPKKKGAKWQRTRILSNMGICAGSDNLLNTKMEVDFDLVHFTNYFPIPTREALEATDEEVGLFALLAQPEITRNLTATIEADASTTTVGVSDMSKNSDNRDLEGKISDNFGDNNAGEATASASDGGEQLERGATPPPRPTTFPGNSSAIGVDSTLPTNTAADAPGETFGTTPPPLTPSTIAARRQQAGPRARNNSMTFTVTAEGDAVASLQAAMSNAMGSVAQRGRATSTEVELYNGDSENGASEALQLARQTTSNVDKLLQVVTLQSGSIQGLDNRVAALEGGVAESVMPLLAEERRKSDQHIALVVERSEAQHRERQAITEALAAQAAKTAKNTWLLQENPVQWVLKAVDERVNNRQIMRHDGLDTSVTTVVEAYTITLEEGISGQSFGKKLKHKINHLLEAIEILANSNDPDRAEKIIILLDIMQPQIKANEVGGSAADSMLMKVSKELHAQALQHLITLLPGVDLSIDQLSPGYMTHVVEANRTMVTRFDGGDTQINTTNAVILNISKVVSQLADNPTAVNIELMKSLVIVANELVRLTNREDVANYFAIMARAMNTVLHNAELEVEAREQSMAICTTLLSNVDGDDRATLSEALVASLVTSGYTEGACGVVEEVFAALREDANGNKTTFTKRSVVPLEALISELTNVEVSVLEDELSEEGKRLIELVFVQLPHLTPDAHARHLVKLIQDIPHFNYSKFYLDAISRSIAALHQHSGDVADMLQVLITEIYNIVQRNDGENYPTNITLLAALVLKHLNAAGNGRRVVAQYLVTVLASYEGQAFEEVYGYISVALSQLVGEEYNRVSNEKDALLNPALSGLINAIKHAPEDFVTPLVNCLIFGKDATFIGQLSLASQANIVQLLIESYRLHADNPELLAVVELGVAEITQQVSARSEALRVVDSSSDDEMFATADAPLQAERILTVLSSLLTLLPAKTTQHEEKVNQLVSRILDVFFKCNPTQGQMYGIPETLHPLALDLIATNVKQGGEIEPFVDMAIVAGDHCKLALSYCLPMTSDASAKTPEAFFVGENEGLKYTLLAEILTKMVDKGLPLEHAIKPFVREVPAGSDGSHLYATTLTIALELIDDSNIRATILVIIMELIKDNPTLLPVYYDAILALEGKDLTRFIRRAFPTPITADTDNSVVGVIPLTLYALQKEQLSKAEQIVKVLNTQLLLAAMVNPYASDPIEITSAIGVVREIQNRATQYNQRLNGRFLDELVLTLIDAVTQRLKTEDLNTNAIARLLERLDLADQAALLAGLLKQNEALIGRLPVSTLTTYTEILLQENDYIDVIEALVIEGADLTGVMQQIVDRARSNNIKPEVFHTVLKHFTEISNLQNDLRKCRDTIGETIVDKVMRLLIDPAVSYELKQVAQKFCIHNVVYTSPAILAKLLSNRTIEAEFADNIALQLKESDLLPIIVAVLEAKDLEGTKYFCEVFGKVFGNSHLMFGQEESQDIFDSIVVNPLDALLVEAIKVMVAKGGLDAEVFESNGLTIEDFLRIFTHQGEGLMVEKLALIYKDIQARKSIEGDNSISNEVQDTDGRGVVEFSASAAEDRRTTAESTSSTQSADSDVADPEIFDAFAGDLLAIANGNNDSNMVLHLVAAQLVGNKDIQKPVTEQLAALEQSRDPFFRDHYRTLSRGFFLADELKDDAVSRQPIHKRLARNTKGWAYIHRLIVNGDARKLESVLKGNSRMLHLSTETFAGKVDVYDAMNPLFLALTQEEVNPEVLRVLLKETSTAKLLIYRMLTEAATLFERVVRREPIGTSTLQAEHGISVAITAQRKLAEDIIKKLETLEMDSETAINLVNKVLEQKIEIEHAIQVSDDVLVEQDYAKVYKAIYTLLEEVQNSRGYVIGEGLSRAYLENNAAYIQMLVNLDVVSIETLRMMAIDAGDFRAWCLLDSVHIKDEVPQKEYAKRAIYCGQDQIAEHILYSFSPGELLTLLDSFVTGVRPQQQEKFVRKFAQLLGVSELHSVFAAAQEAQNFSVLNAIQTYAKDAAYQASSFVDRVVGDVSEAISQEVIVNFLESNETVTQATLEKLWTKAVERGFKDVITALINAHDAANRLPVKDVIEGTYLVAYDDISLVKVITVNRSNNHLTWMRLLQEYAEKYQLFFVHYMDNQGFVTATLSECYNNDAIEKVRVETIHTIFNAALAEKDFALVNRILELEALPPLSSKQKETVCATANDDLVNLLISTEAADDAEEKVELLLTDAVLGKWSLAAFEVLLRNAQVINYLNSSERTNAPILLSEILDRLITLEDINTIFELLLLRTDRTPSWVTVDQMQAIIKADTVLGSSLDEEEGSVLHLLAKASHWSLIEALITEEVLPFEVIEPLLLDLLGWISEHGVESDGVESSDVVRGLSDKEKALVFGIYRLLVNHAETNGFAAETVSNLEQFIALPFFASMLQDRDTIATTTQLFNRAVRTLNTTLDNSQVRNLVIRLLSVGVTFEETILNQLWQFAVNEPDALLLQAVYNHSHIDINQPLDGSTVPPLHALCQRAVIEDIPELRIDARNAVEMLLMCGANPNAGDKTALQVVLEADVTESNPVLAAAAAAAATASTEPASTEPVSAEPVLTAPVSTAPVSTAPVLTASVADRPATVSNKGQTADNFSTKASAQKVLATMLCCKHVQISNKDKKTLRNIDVVVSDWSPNGDVAINDEHTVVEAARDEESIRVSSVLQAVPIAAFDNKGRDRLRKAVEECVKKPNKQVQYFDQISTLLDQHVPIAPEIFTTIISHENPELLAIFVDYLGTISGQDTDAIEVETQRNRLAAMVEDRHLWDQENPVGILLGKLGLIKQLLTSAHYIPSTFKGKNIPAERTKAIFTTLVMAGATLRPEADEVVAALCANEELFAIALPHLATLFGNEDIPALILDKLGKSLSTDLVEIASQYQFERLTHVIDRLASSEANVDHQSGTHLDGAHLDGAHSDGAHSDGGSPASREPASTDVNGSDVGESIDVIIQRETRVNKPTNKDEIKYLYTSLIAREVVKRVTGLANDLTVQLPLPGEVEESLRIVANYRLASRHEDKRLRDGLKLLAKHGRIDLSDNGLVNDLFVYATKSGHAKTVTWLLTFNPNILLSRTDQILALLETVDSREGNDSSSVGVSHVTSQTTGSLSLSATNSAQTVQDVITDHLFNNIVLYFPMLFSHAINHGVENGNTDQLLRLEEHLSQSKCGPLPHYRALVREHLDAAQTERLSSEGASGGVGFDSTLIAGAQRDRFIDGYMTTHSNLWYQQARVKRAIRLNNAKTKVANVAILDALLEECPQVVIAEVLNWARELSYKHIVNLYDKNPLENNGVLTFMHRHQELFADALAKIAYSNKNMALLDAVDISLVSPATVQQLANKFAKSRYLVSRNGSTGSTSGTNEAGSNTSEYQVERSSLPERVKQNRVKLRELFARKAREAGYVLPEELSLAITAYNRGVEADRDTVSSSDAGGASAVVIPTPSNSRVLAHSSRIAEDGQDRTDVTPVQVANRASVVDAGDEAAARVKLKSNKSTATLAKNYADFMNNKETSKPKRRAQHALHYALRIEDKEIINAVIAKILEDENTFNGRKHIHHLACKEHAADNLRDFLGLCEDASLVAYCREQYEFAPTPDLSSGDIDDDRLVEMVFQAAHFAFIHDRKKDADNKIINALATFVEGKNSNKALHSRLHAALNEAIDLSNHDIEGELTFPLQQYLAYLVLNYVYVRGHISNYEYLKESYHEWIKQAFTTEKGPLIITDPAEQLEKLWEGVQIDDGQPNSIEGFIALAKKGLEQIEWELSRCHLISKSRAKNIDMFKHMFTIFIEELERDMDISSGEVLPESTEALLSGKWKDLHTSLTEKVNKTLIEHKRSGSTGGSRTPTGTGSASGGDDVAAQSNAEAKVNSGKTTDRKSAIGGGSQAPTDGPVGADGVPLSPIVNTSVDQDRRIDAVSPATSYLSDSADNRVVGPKTLAEAKRRSEHQRDRDSSPVVEVPADLVSSILADVNASSRTGGSRNRSSSGDVAERS